MFSNLHNIFKIISQIEASSAIKSSNPTTQETEQEQESPTQSPEQASEHPSSVSDTPEVSALTNQINNQLDTFLKRLLLLKNPSHGHLIKKSSDAKPSELEGSNGHNNIETRSNKNVDPPKKKHSAAGNTNNNGHYNHADLPKGTRAKDITDAHREVAQRYGLNDLDLLTLLRVLNDGVPHKERISLDDLIELLESAENGGQQVSYTDPNTGEIVEFNITRSEFLTLIGYIKDEVNDRPSSPHAPSTPLPTFGGHTSAVPVADAADEALDQNAEDIAEDIIDNIEEDIANDGNEAIANIIDKVKRYVFKGVRSFFTSNKDFYIQGLKAKQKTTYEETMTNLFASSVQSNKKSQESETDTNRLRAQLEKKDERERQQQENNIEKQLINSERLEYNAELSAERADLQEGELDFAVDPAPLNDNTIVSQRQIKL